MELIPIIFLGITAAYFIVILALILGDLKLKSFHFEESESNKQFSIIIPFRNEEEYLPDLLISLKKLNYPKSCFEVFFVDDYSNDSSVELIKKALKKTEIDFHIVNNQRATKSPKKDALQTAISLTKNEYIITTDADCIVPEYWLKSLDCFLQKEHAQMIVGSVSLIHQKAFLQKFQALEMLSLQTATKGGFGWQLPFLSNGANLCFSKKVFLELNGYQGNSHLASGDDIFLLEKFILNDKKVRFLKSEKAEVKTFAEKHLKAAIQQRIRWASKSKHYQLKRAKLVGMIVFLMNLTLILIIPSMLFQWIDLITFFLVVGIKFLIDFISMGIQLKEQKEYGVLWAFPFSAIIYPFFSVWITLKSFIGTYHWKERKFKV